MKINNSLSLELLSINHTEALSVLINNNRSYLRQSLSWLDCNTTINDTRNFITHSLDLYNQKTAQRYLINYKGDICGLIGFHYIDQFNRKATMGYWLAEKSTGQGIMTCSAGALLKIGFNVLRLNKIEIRCAEKNHKSQSIAKRLGFTYEATLRQCEWHYTHFVNHKIYSLLSSEYKHNPIKFCNPS